MGRVPDPAPARVRSPMRRRGRPGVTRPPLREPGGFYRFLPRLTKSRGGSWRAAPAPPRFRWPVRRRRSTLWGGCGGGGGETAGGGKAAAGRGGGAWRNRSGGGGRGGAG